MTSDRPQQSPDEVFRALTEGKDHYVLVVHRSHARRVLVSQAVSEATVGDVRIHAVAATTPAAALSELDVSPEKVVGLLLESTPDPQQRRVWLTRLKSTFKNLIRIIDLVPTAISPAEPPDPAFDARIPFGSATQELADAFGHTCRLEVGTIAGRIRFSKDLKALLDLLASMRDPEALMRLSRLLIRQLSDAYGLDACLVSDLSNFHHTSPEPFFGGNVRVTHYAHDAVRNLYAKQHGTAVSREEHEMSHILQEGNLLHGRVGRQEVSVGQFYRIPIGGKLALACLVLMLGGSLVAGLGLVPSRRLGNETRLALGSFRGFVRAWAIAYESVFEQRLNKLQHALRSTGDRRRDAVDEMVVGIAHEINTPLGVINTASSIIEATVQSSELQALAARDDVAREVADDLVQASTMIGNNVTRLGELVSRFKMLSATQLMEEAAPVRIEALILESMEEYRARAQTKLVFTPSFDLEPSCDIWMGYAKQLRLILDNVYSNVEHHAYLGQGGLIEVRLRGRELEGQRRYLLAVADYGVGLSEEARPRIFDAFYTTARGSQSCLGLGLTLVENLVVHSLGGQVRCEAKAGMGTTILIEFGTAPTV